MKKYLFSRKGITDKLFILAYGKNRKQAKEKIFYPCTYIGIAENSERYYTEVYGISAIFR